MNKTIICVFCLFVIAGCQNQLKPEEDINQQYLSSMIEEIHKEVQLMRGGSEGYSSYRKDKIPTILRSTLDVQWYGEGEVVLKEIAKNFSEEMEFKVIGIKPPHPHDVFLNERGIMLFDILENIGNQLPPSVVLNVISSPFKKRVVVKLEYK